MALGSHIQKAFGMENKEGVGPGTEDQNRKVATQGHDAETAQKHFRCHGSRMVEFVVQ